MRNLVLLILVFVMLISCRSEDELARTKITATLVLDSIPSGSGLALLGDTLYIVGDDAPYVYKMNQRQEGFSRIGIKGIVEMGQLRIPKEVKPDLEGAVFMNLRGRRRLVAFGSGSMSPERDWLLVMDPRNPDSQRMMRISGLYEGLRERTQTEPEDWNIEGVTVAEDSVMLLNRGNNRGILFSVKDFEAYLERGELPGRVREVEILLPMVNEHPARISGAAALSGKKVLFTASIEDTPNWYTDGPIMGSLVGVFDKNSGNLDWYELLKEEKGELLKQKVESVVMVRNGEDGMELMLVADNDDGRSTLIRVQCFPR